MRDREAKLSRRFCAHGWIGLPQLPLALRNCARRSKSRYQERLTQRLAAVAGPEFNQQRVLEEVAVLVERSDVSEELARMSAHIEHFRELLRPAAKPARNSTSCSRR